MQSEHWEQNLVEDPEATSLQPCCLVFELPRSVVELGYGVSEKIWIGKVVWISLAEPSLAF